MKIPHWARFSILAFFSLYLAKKWQKFTKNEENWQNPNRLMKLSEIWYVDASQQKKMLQQKHFSISDFLPFLAKKHPKFTKNKEIGKIQTVIMEFSEIWYVDASQQKKFQQINFFSILAFLGLF